MQLGALGVHGGLTLRHDVRKRIFSGDRTVTDPTSGAFQSASRLCGTSGDDRLTKIATLGVDLDLSKVDRLSAEGTNNARSDLHRLRTECAADGQGAVQGQSGIGRPGRAKLIADYDLQRDDNLFDNGQIIATGPGGAAIADPNFTNTFRYGQTIHAFYGSYEKPLGP